MWSFFARESFPYEIGEKFADFFGYSVFSLHRGQKKNSGEKVSIFTYTVKGGSSAYLENARTAIKKLKTLRHPSILTFIDSYEDENVIHLVTEPVTPLLTYLEGIKHLEASEMYLKWGLSSISEAIKFLNEHNQRHNNIFHGSIFVDTSGSWKLGEIGYLSSESAPYPRKVIDNLLKYDPPSKHHLSPVSSDYWGIGVLIWEVFNGELKDADSLIRPRKIPKDILQHFQVLTKQPSGKLEVINDFIEECSRDNLLFTTLDNLQNYHLKDKDVKAKVCKVLLTLLPNIPKDMLLNKIIKLLRQAYDFDSENSAFLVPVVSKIPSLVSEEEFQASVENFIITLFSSNDRATRLALLMNIEEIINKINNKSINELFPYVSTGFLDSNSKIRGETVKALVHFAPKLSKRVLNDDALRHLLQIQSKDPEAYIRTNTTICLGKIAHCLQPDTRKKILITAFLQALRDPYPAVRNAGVQAFAVTHRFFPLENIARNVLPGLVCLTVDVDPSVRQNAFKTIKILFSKLEKYSESPELKEELEKDVSSHTIENSSSWSGWAFAAITSKFLKSSDTRIKSVDSDALENKSTADHSTSAQNLSVLDENVSKDSANEFGVRKDSLSTFSEKKSSSIHESVLTLKKDSIQSQHGNKSENKDVYGGSDEDKSDWDDDGWGEAHEEVLVPSKSSLRTPSQQGKREESNSKKKTIAGPMKLGTRLTK